MEIDPKINVDLLAEPAAGNQYINDSVVTAVLKHRPDHVLVMWSGVSRLDYLTSLEDPAWCKMYDDYGFIRRVNERLGYIFSGGRMGTWFGNPVAQRMFKEMYKVANPRSLGYINVLEMVKLQQFLRSMNVSYHFMSYVNYWNDRERVSRNGDFGVLRYPELQELAKHIDFDSWIFYNEQKDCIFELAQQLDDFRDDRFHPGDTAQRQWAELIYQRLQKDGLV